MKPRNALYSIVAVAIAFWSKLALGFSTKYHFEHGSSNKANTKASISYSYSSFALNMAPRYNPSTKRWEATTSEEEEGYPPSGTLIRQGPKPYLQRIINPDDYDQGVLKMMANDSTMSRDEAQGNMDAYLRNPNDWALQKIEEEKGISPKVNYGEMVESQELILTGIWSSILLALVARVVYVYTVGCDAFCQANHF